MVWGEEDGVQNLCTPESRNNNDFEAQKKSVSIFI